MEIMTGRMTLVLMKGSSKDNAGGNTQEDLFVKPLLILLEAGLSPLLSSGGRLEVSISSPSEPGPCRSPEGAIFICGPGYPEREGVHPGPRHLLDLLLVHPTQTEH